jgi:hypothetical protein
VSSLVLTLILAALGALCAVALGQGIRVAYQKDAFGCARCLYIAFSAFIAAYAVAWLGYPAIHQIDLVRNGPISDLGITIVSILLAWALLGGLLFTLGRSLSPEQWFYWAVFYLLAFSYVTVLRERSDFGDVHDYMAAAFNLAHHQKLHSRYLYPPLFATLLQPLVPLGASAIEFTCIAVNFASLLLLFALLQRTLVRYGFAGPTATLLTFVALAANTPVLRTLFYAQPNLHVANLILLSLLLYPKHCFGSAVALAVAAHIKTAPLILVLPFLVNRDWKWLGWYALGLIGVIALTVSINGFGPYRDYLNNISNIYGANGINYRDNSIDSLVRSTYTLFGVNADKATRLIQLVRAAVGVAGLYLTYGAVRWNIFSVSSSTRVARVDNAFPVLLLLMMTLSPLLWEHHPVLILLSSLVVIKNLKGKGEWMLFLVAYFLIFLLPTFDLYPFSYHILVGTLGFYYLVWRFGGRTDRNGAFFTSLNRTIERIPRAFAARRD